MRVMAFSSTSVFAKCLRADEDGHEDGHLCHIDTFLVAFFYITKTPLFKYIENFTSKKTKIFR